MYISYTARYTDFLQNILLLYTYRDVCLEFSSHKQLSMILKMNMPHSPESVLFICCPPGALQPAAVETSILMWPGVGHHGPTGSPWLQHREIPGRLVPRAALGRLAEPCTGRCAGNRLHQDTNPAWLGPCEGIV